MFFDKKTKREKINYEMIIENTFCDHLSTKAKEGLVLCSMNMEDIVYTVEEPCEKKYQIEYGETEYEYDDFLNELGYKEVCTYKNLKILVNDDINAPDLHTDEFVRLNAVKKLGKINNPILTALLSLLGILPVFLVGAMIKSRPLMIGSIFKEPELFIFVGFVAFIMLLWMVIIIQTITVKNIVNKKLSGDEVNYKSVHIVTNMTRYIILIYGMLFLMLILFFIPYMFKEGMHFIVYMLVAAVFMIADIMLAKLLTKFRVNKKIHPILHVFILFFGITIAQEISAPYKTDANNTITVQPYMQECSYQNRNNRIFYEEHYYSYNEKKENTLWDLYSGYEEVYIDCINEFVAKEIMKYELVMYENETRSTPDAIHEIISQKQDYSKGDIPFYSYKKALQQLEVYENKQVEECYYNHHFFIARKDNKLLVSYMQDEDNYIDNVIEHYFK